MAIATVATAARRDGGRLAIGDLDLTPPLASLFWLAVLGLTSQSLGYLFISISLPRLPAVADLADPARPAGHSTVLSLVLLGERPSPAQLAGVALVIGGIAVATIPIGRLRDALRATRSGEPTDEVPRRLVD